MGFLCIGVFCEASGIGMLRVFVRKLESLRDKEVAGEKERAINARRMNQRSTPYP